MTPRNDLPPKSVSIRQATPSDREALIDTLVRAFADDPMYTWLTARDHRFDQRYRKLFGAYLDHLAFPHGQVWTTEDRKATALWAPPGCWELGLVQQLRFAPDWLQVIGLKNLWTRWRAVEQIQSRHPHTPHWYLMVIGADPEVQGQGRASALMKPVLEICDQMQTGAYLETPKASNIPIYERFGFKVTEELRIPNGPTLWLMWRNPQPLW